LSHTEFAENQAETANFVAELVRHRGEPETTFYLAVVRSLREGVEVNSTRATETITGLNSGKIRRILNEEPGVAIPKVPTYSAVTEIREILDSLATRQFKPLSSLAVDDYGAAMVEDIPKLLAETVNIPGEITVYQPAMTLSDGRPVRLVWILRITPRPGLHAYYLFNLINDEVRLANRDVFKQLRDLRRARANKKELRVFAKAVQQYFQAPFFSRGSEGLGNSWLAGEFHGIFDRKLPFMESVGRMAMVKDETEFADWFLKKLETENRNPDL